MRLQLSRIERFLFSKGHVFTNNTDTEVILAAYKEWGLASLSKLNGMFSFCLYDRNLEKIFLVRDRVGEKPLYYTNSDKGLAFSSEIKVLRIPTFPEMLILMRSIIISLTAPLMVLQVFSRA